MGNRCQSNKQTNKHLLLLDNSPPEIRVLQVWSLVGWQCYEETVEPFKRCALEGGSFIMVYMPPRQLWYPDILPIHPFFTSFPRKMADVWLHTDSWAVTSWSVAYKNDWKIDEKDIWRKATKVELSKSSKDIKLPVFHINAINLFLCHFQVDLWTKQPWWLCIEPTTWSPTHQGWPGYIYCWRPDLPTAA